ncbi:MAG: glycosyltransferase [Clostridia bacterium]|nr:glycosyltransferase [Clostridia bacterium]
MNILLVTMEMNIGGAETHVLELAKELKNQGHEVYVSSAGGSLVAELEKNGVTHVYAPLKDKKIAHVFSSMKILKQTIKDKKIDVVHAHARIPGAICGVVCKKTKTHFVTTIHGIYRVNAILKIITNWGEKTLAVSHDIREHAIKTYKLNPDNIKVTINGINLEKFKKQEIKDDLGIAFNEEKKKIVHVSRLDEESSDVAKSLISIAGELEEESENGVQIIIVGSGSYIEKLKQEAASKANVILTGARKDIEKILNKADIFVGVSRAALEAMAVELPIILVGNPKYGQGYQGIFDAQSLEMAKNTNFTCRGLQEINKETLKNDILKLLNENKEEMGKYNRSVVMSEYSAKKMASDALELYKF